ncbi:MAG: ABC transporter ATP-binding protein [Coriobacteriia bacterium]|nr:ABC transporter ATP-binding protein [Coriobacteriia bacterium]
MQNYVVETSGLTKRYKDKNVVDRIDLRVEQGQIYGFLGLNGAGKTTTIRMLMGLIRPSAGQARLFGRPIPADRLQVMRRVGALVESPSYYAHLSGWDNLKIVAILLDAPERRIAEVLDIVRLTGDAKRKVGDYSLGMKQRLGIAAALVGSPDLLVLDEPTNGLDPAGIHEVRDLIRRMPREHGITVVVSSHLLAEVDQMATAVGVIHAGRLIFQGPIGDLRARSRGHVSVQVDRLEEAVAIAEESQLGGVMAEGERLRFDSTAPADAARLVRALVDRDIAVYRVEEQQLTLEDIFLELTAEASPT